MKPVFQLENYAAGFRQDYEAAADAIAMAEKLGAGTVVKFARRPNLPGLWPKVVHNCVGMWRYESGVWTQHAIYDGWGAAFAEGKPQ